MALAKTRKVVLTRTMVLPYSPGWKVPPGTEIIHDKRKRRRGIKVVEKDKDGNMAEYQFHYSVEVWKYIMQHAHKDGQ